MVEDPNALLRLEEQLKDLGLPGLERVTGALTAASAPGLDDAGRLAEVMKMYDALADSALAVLDGELKKVETLRARAPNPALDDMLFAFHEQREGLLALKEFFQNGDTARMREAKEKLQRGAQTARHAARGANPTK